MPRYDGTGPLGMGAGAGRGLGSCGLGSRQGFSRGCRGYGFRRWTKQDETVALREEKDILKNELKEVEKELSSLKNQK
ncbi:DUF5320 domain-containing protein [Patescibacteria group bacterium]|nr:DUF5320 domain-containing protein [Patescibacteria group bacterium]MBU2068348.1 DUF5320 domain-containing protein [Patescibacteria group bacterium]